MTSVILNKVLYSMQKRYEPIPGVFVETGVNISSLKRSSKRAVSRPPVCFTGVYFTGVYRLENEVQARLNSIFCLLVQ